MDKAYSIKIPPHSFFGGLQITVDPNLPPDTVEIRGATRVRLNVKTGEITTQPRVGQKFSANVELCSGCDTPNYCTEFNMCNRNMTAKHVLGLCKVCGKAECELSEPCYPTQHQLDKAINRCVNAGDFEGALKLNEQSADEAAYKSYAETPSTPADMQPGGALRGAWFNGLNYGRSTSAVSTVIKPEAKHLPPKELSWLYSHCKAIGMNCKSDSGKWEDDIALFTTNLQDEIKALKEQAEQAPAQQVEAAKVPVAWAYKCGGEMHATFSKEEADKWEKQGFTIKPLAYLENK